MERCFFAKKPPKIEVRGGIIFIKPEHGDYEVAVTPHVLGQFIACANRALDEFHEKRTVVPIRASR